MKVIVTRPRTQAKPLVAALEAIGAVVVECPLIEIERTSAEPIDAAGYEWLVVTSSNGADEIVRRGRNLPRVAAVVGLTVVRAPLERLLLGLLRLVRRTAVAAPIVSFPIVSAALVGFPVRRHRAQA